MVAHIIQDNFILENEDNDGEKTPKRASKTTKISQKVQNAVYLSANNL